MVGATSRPDLLDAALLRPGRLDRHVLCGFPSPLERGAVLRALSRGVQLAPDVDLGQVKRCMRQAGGGRCGRPAWRI